MKTLGIFLILLGVGLGCYLGIYVCLYGGIIQVIQNVTPEIKAVGLAGGIVRIVVSGVIGQLSAMLFIIPGFNLIIKYL